MIISMISNNEVIYIDIKIDNSGITSLIRELTQQFNDLNNTAYIDIKIDNKEITSLVGELAKQFNDLNDTVLDVSSTISQVNNAVEDTGSLFLGIGASIAVWTKLNGFIGDAKRTQILWNQVAFAGELIVAAFTKELKLNEIATLAVATAKTILSKVFLASPIFMMAMVITGVVVAFKGLEIAIGLVGSAFGRCSITSDRLNNEIDLLSDAMEQNKQASQENARAFDQNLRAIDANSSSVQNQMERLKELSGQEELSASEKVKMNHLIEQLNGSVEDLNLAYDEEIGQLNMSTDAMEDKVVAYLDINDEISRMQLAQEQMNQLSEEEIQIARDLEEVVALQNQLTEAREEGLIGTREYRNGMEELEEKLDDVKHRQEENTEAQMKAAEIIAQSQEKIAQATEESSTRQKVAFETLSAAQQSVIETLQREFNGYVDTLRDGNNKIDTSNSLSAENWKETMLHNQETMSAWADNVDSLTDRVSTEMLEYVKSLGPEHAGLVQDMVNMSNDELKDLESVFGDNIEVAERAALSGIASSRIPEETHHLISDTGETMAQSIEKANFKDLGLKIPDGLSTGIEEGQDDVNKAVADTMDGAAEAGEKAAQINSPSKVFIRIANNLMQGLLKGIRDDRPKVTKELSQLRPDFDKAGRDAMDGLNAGLNARRSTVLNTARSIANEVTRTIRSALDINSPSRVMRDQVGKFIPEGIAVGIDAESDTVMDAMQSISDGMIKIPKISPESLVESSRGGLFTPSSSTQSPITNHHNTHNEGLFNGATIIWKGKEDIRQTMQEMAWITQTEGARM